MMQGAPSPARGARIKVYAQRFGATRGARFELRMAGRPVPHLGQCSAVPEWLQADTESDCETLANMMALLHFRPQIDKELSGLKLGLMASELGEALYDAACAAPCPESDLCASPSHGLPRPDEMRACGRALLAAAIPTALAFRFEGAHGDAAMAALASQAFSICADLGLLRAEAGA